MKTDRLKRARQIAAKHRQQTGRQNFRAETKGGRGSLYLYDTIGGSWWDEGITAKMVTSALDEMSDAEGVDIYVNSPGGDIFEAKAIFAALRRFQGERVVYVDGIAASAASYIAMAGDRIITAPGATWMIHEVWAIGVGNAADHLAMAELLEKENGTFAEAYAKRTGQTVDDVLAWMNAETWMTATEAKERGFTDEIAEADVVEDDDNEDLVAALGRATENLRASAA